MTAHEQALCTLVFGTKNSSSLTGRGWSLYRDMARGRIRDLLGAAFPKTRHAIGEALFETLFVRWLDEHPPASGYFRESAVEFSRWLTSTGEAGDGTLAGDCLALETLYWTLAYELVKWPALKPLDFGAPLATNPTLRLLRLSHTAHRDMPEMKHADTRLAVARRQNDDVVCWKEIDELEWRVLSASSERDLPLVDCVRDAARELHRDVDETFVADLAVRLEVLLASGIVLGSTSDG